MSITDTAQWRSAGATTGGERRDVRVPPHNLVAEESLLGAMLLSRDAIADVLETVSAEQFYRPAHARVFEAVHGLYSAGEPADAITVAAVLERSGSLEAIGGLDGLLSLQMNTPATSNAASYARIVREHYTLRRLIQVAGEIAELGYGRPDDVTKAVDWAENLMYQVAQGQVGDNTVQLSELLDGTLDRLEELYEHGGSITGTATGYTDLDKLLSGLQPSSLYVVGGRPSMGKTSFALGMAAHAAIKVQRPVLVFSLEMGHMELTQRLLCSEARIDSTKMRDGRLSDDDWNRITGAISRLSTAPMWIDDNPNVTVTVQLSELLDGTLDRLEELYEHGGSITGTATGYTDLDKLLSGLQPSSLYVVGGRPSMGKTSFALGMAAHAAIKVQRPVLVFSLEMGHMELTQRLLCAEARIDSTKMRDGRLSDDDWNRITGAISRLSTAPMWIDDNPNVTVMEIRARARRLKSQVGDIAMIVVDYLQLMTGRQAADNRQVEVAEISRGLKILARELEVPVVALSQLSRNLEMRQQKRPMLADLRESGAIEQDADVVMFIYRDEVYNPDNADTAGTAEIIVAKNRNGPTATTTLAFLSRFTTFANFAARAAI